MDYRFFRPQDDLFRHQFGVGSVMTTAGGGAAGDCYIADMPSATMASDSSALSTSDAIPSSNISVSQSRVSIVAASPGSGQSSPPVIITNVNASPVREVNSPSLGAEVTIGDAPVTQLTAQVVVANSTGNSSINSPALVSSLAKNTIVAADTPHLITVTDGCSARSYTSLTPVNPGLVSADGDGAALETVSAGGASATVGGYVQYVDSNHDPLYSPANGQMAFPVYTVADAMYTNGTAYYSPGSTPVPYSQEVASSPLSNQLISGGGTYIIQQSIEPDTTPPPPTVNNSRVQNENEGGNSYLVSGGSNVGTTVDEDAQANIAHAARVSPVTVQWLIANYETAEGVSLPRSTLYNHYLRHCADNKLDPVNAATFGKLIRSVFIGLRTRRLGTRGNSKYHYYGLRIKATSPLANISDDGSPINLRSQGSLKKGQSAQSPNHQGGQCSSPSKDTQYDSCAQAPAEASPQTIHHQQFLGDYSRAAALVTGDINISGCPLPTEVTKQHITRFTHLYREHCENILDAVYNLQFESIEGIWQKFWMMNNNNISSQEKLNSNDSHIDDDDGDLITNLPSSAIQPLLCCEPVLEFIQKVDYIFYQNLVNLLIPDVLRSIPPNLTQKIRNFAKSLESWLVNAMIGCPSDVVRIKVKAALSFAQTLRRYTSLNHLAQAARAVLQNTSQISQMLTDLNRVDFKNVQEQASWVCQCNERLVQNLEEDFKATLQQQSSLEQWAQWLQSVVDQVLQPHENKPGFAKHAQQFLLKWSFYSSMVIRDLTLRSAASFGSFHLIRLLYDEYMFYLVEQKVASEANVTPIAVMSQFLGSADSTQVTYDVLNGENLFSEDRIASPSIKKIKYESP